jgi:hypothetical protein
MLQALTSGHGAVFHQVPAFHHGDPVGEAPHQVQVVRDQQHRHAGLALQVREQFQDLQAQGDVQGGRRLVGQQQARPAGERHGDHGPLALAAGKLVRVGGGTAAPAPGQWRGASRRRRPTLPGGQPASAALRRSGRRWCGPGQGRHRLRKIMAMSSRGCQSVAPGVQQLGRRLPGLRGHGEHRP